MGFCTLIRASLYLLPYRNPYSPLPPSLRFLSSIRGSSKKHSFTVSYLINSCGLSPSCALLASESVHFETLDKPESVLFSLNNFGLAHTQISTIVRKYPPLLMCNPEKTLLPKLEFLKSKGMSISEIVDFLASYPLFYTLSLKNNIIPYFNMLKDFFPSDKKTLDALSRFHLHGKHENVMQKINYLRKVGVPESLIGRTLYSWPGVLVIHFHKFTKIVEQVREIGLNPSHFRFVYAVATLKGMSEATWERKLNAFKTWGLSEEEILVAFKKEPQIMAMSQEKIMATMDLFVNKLGWKSSFIVQCPIFTSFSLEKRLVPRASVLQFLVTKGLVDKGFSSPCFFRYNETQFLKRFVNRYDEAPELLKLYGQTPTRC